MDQKSPWFGSILIALHMKETKKLSYPNSSLPYYMSNCYFPFLQAAIALEMWDLAAACFHQMLLEGLNQVEASALLWGEGDQ